MKKETFKENRKTTICCELFLQITHLQIKAMWRKKYRNNSTIYFTRRRNIMQGHWSLRGRTHLFYIKMKSALFYFVSLFNKNILKQQYAENAAKSDEIEVLDFLKLRNVFFTPTYCWGKVKESSRCYVNVSF